MARPAKRKLRTHIALRSLGQWSRSEAPAAACALPGAGSSDSLDGGSGWDGMRNLGHLVHHLGQVSELIGGDRS